MQKTLDKIIISGNEYSIGENDVPLLKNWDNLSTISGTGYLLYANSTMSTSSATDTGKYILNNGYKKVELYAGMDGTKDANVPELAIGFYKGEGISSENYLKSSSVQFKGEGSEQIGRWYSADVPEECTIITFSNRRATNLNPVIKIYGSVENAIFDINEKIEDIKSSSSSGEVVPSFIFNEAKKTYKRIVEWANTENVYLLAQVTDVHSGGSDKYKVVGYLNELNKIYSFDCLCNAGDIGLDTSATTGDEEKVFELMWNTRKGMNCTNPWIFCKGNHERLVNLQTLGNIYNRSFQRQFPNIVFGDEYGNYGYLDCENKKIRTYFLNTSDATNETQYAISKAQLEWLISSMATLEDAWGIILNSHLCVDSIGRWKSYPTDAAGAGFDTLRALLVSFVARTSGSNSTIGVSWDFTNTKAKLVCSFAGDSHFNNQIKRDGVNYIVRQGYGGISDVEKPSEAVRYSFSTSTSCCFDVLAVKTNGNAKVFRIGAGGEEADYAFTY